MTDALVPWLEPSLIVGLGAWGGAVARAAEAALQERSPALARACRTLALADGATPDLPELLRAQLRVSRMAEVIRALALDGLMRLDPVVSPSTHVYLVGSAGEIPLLHAVAALIDEAAAELKAKVIKVAVVDVAGGRIPPAPTFPVYCMEPVTAQGLVLDDAEYRAAAAELLVAAAQPGGSQILAGGRGTGTLGIAWLTWSPAALRDSLAGRLAAEALRNCLTATAPPQRAPDLAAGREAALLEGLPTAWGSVQHPRRLKRAAAVLDRRLDRWSARIRTRAGARGQVEAQQLTAAAQQVLTAGPDGLARLRGLLEATAREAVRRQDQTPSPERPPVGPPLRALLRRLAAAEALPGVPAAALALGGGLAVFTLIWWLTGGKALSWLGGTLFQLIVFGGYMLWRPWRIRKAAAAVAEALTRRGEAAVQAAYRDSITRLDEAIEKCCSAARADLERLPHVLGGPAASEAVPPKNGALCFPLVAAEAAGPIYRDLQQLLPDLGARLAAAGVLLQWQDPARLRQEAEAEVRRALAERAPLDPAQAATRAYGDRLAPHLRDLVSHLLEWSQPLLARQLRLPEGRRWLLWPEGLPCPPVPAEVSVLPYARSCVAAVHVLTGLPTTTERTAGETA